MLILLYSPSSRQTHIHIIFSLSTIDMIRRETHRAHSLTHRELYVHYLCVLTSSVYIVNLFFVLNEKDELAATMYAWKYSLI